MSGKLKKNYKPLNKFSLWSKQSLLYIHRGIEFCGKHPFATGIFAILSLVGLTLSIVGYIYDRDEARDTTKQVQNLEEKLDIIKKEVNLSKAEKLAKNSPFFNGKWDETKAFKVAWRNPRPNESYDEGGHGDQLEKSFFISLRGIDKRMIITSISSGSCQGCTTELSLFVFHKEGNSWFLVQKSIDFMNSGREVFNDVSNSIEVWHIGPDRFGIVFNINTWHQGKTTKYIEIYTFISNELTLILRGDIREYFSGIEKEEAIEMGFWFEKKLDIQIDDLNSNFGLYNLNLAYSSNEVNHTLTKTVKFSGDKYHIKTLTEIKDCKGGINEFIKNEDCKKRIINKFL